MLYTLCNRDMVSQAMANVPLNEQPTREELESWMPHSNPIEDFAWTELFSKCCTWLNDREQRKKAEAQSKN